MGSIKPLLIFFASILEIF